ncbi:hypothetical protein MKX01_027287 [Papaver californicum]|nr:hypothetical protein MKX01_027287 [Papaver californicum]
MEEILKVYIYKEGDKPIFHDPKLEGVYASEGWFMKHMEKHKRFVVQDPAKAHLFYLPFSSERIRYSSLYDRKTRSQMNFIKLLSDYLDIIKANFPFWNRTGGTDHFFTACHDWVGPHMLLKLYALTFFFSFEVASILTVFIFLGPNNNKTVYEWMHQTFCNSDVNDDCVLGKDVALAETLVLSKLDLLKDIGGKPPSERETLAFFA